MGTEVNFCWVPAHEEVKGNEIADECAKKATNKAGIDIMVKYSKTEINMWGIDGKNSGRKKEQEDGFNSQRIVDKDRITERNRQGCT